MGIQLKLQIKYWNREPNIFQLDVLPSEKQTASYYIVNMLQLLV